MNIKADLKKRILSKIEEGYNEGGRLVEMGEVSLYPDPAPSVDPTVQGSGKVLQVDSDLLRDLLNWATSADAGSIDAVVAKAEEMGMSSPLTPAQLVDLTATAHTADPSNPSVNACTQPDAAGITSPVVPAGPVGPLSPVMASFQRRGKKVEELASLPKMDKSGGQQVGGKGKMPVKAAIALNKQVKGHEKRTGQKFDGTQDTLMGIGEDDVIDGVAHEPITTPKQMGNKNPGVVAPVKEDDIIDSDNEVITTPEQMGNKNPGIDADGGETPEGLPLGDEKNKGNDGLAEDGVEDVAAAIADGISDGITGDESETEPEVNALPGEGIPQDDDDAAINAKLGEPVSPPVGGDEGLVGQVAALNARVAELEALLGGTASEAPEAEIEIGGEDELSIDGEEGEGEEGEEGEENGEEGEDSEEKEDDKEESDEEGESSDDEKEDDESGEEDEEGKKLLLGDEEEDKK